MALDTNNALTPLAKAKQYIGSRATTDFDSRIESAINSASHRANSHTGRLLKKRSYDEIYDGDGSQRLLTKNYPIVESSSSQIQVFVVGARDSFASTTDFDSDSQVAYSDIFVNAERGEIRLKDNDFMKGTENIRVVYSAGYSTTNATTSSDHIPADLQDAVHETVAFQFEKQRQRAWLTRSVAHDDGSVNFYDTMPQMAWSALDSYKDYRG